MFECVESKNFTESQLTASWAPSPVRMMNRLVQLELWLELIVWRLSESDVNMQPTLLIIQTPNKQNLANSQFEIM